MWWVLGGPTHCPGSGPGWQLSLSACQLLHILTTRVSFPALSWLVQGQDQLSSIQGKLYYVTEVRCETHSPECCLKAKASSPAFISPRPAHKPTVGAKGWGDLSLTHAITWQILGEEQVLLLSCPWGQRTHATANKVSSTVLPKQGGGPAFRASNEKLF